MYTVGQENSSPLPRTGLQDTLSQVTERATIAQTNLGTLQDKIWNFAHSLPGFPATNPPTTNEQYLELIDSAQKLISQGVATQSEYPPIFTAFVTLVAPQLFTSQEKLAKNLRKKGDSWFLLLFIALFIGGGTANIILAYLSNLVSNTNYKISWNSSTILAVSTPALLYTLFVVAKTYLNRWAISKERKGLE